MSDLSELAQAIRKARLRAGLSQRGLAALAGVSETIIGNIENGSRRPSRPMAERLCEVLGLEPTRLGLEQLRHMNRDYGRRRTPLEQLPDLLREYRERRSYTQGELERRAGLRAGSVAAFEAGAVIPTRWQAAKLYRALEIPLEPPLGLPEKSERLDGAPERLSPVELALFTQKAPPLIAAAMREHHISWCCANGYEPYIQEGA